MNVHIEPASPSPAGRSSLAPVTQERSAPRVRHGRRRLVVILVGLLVIAGTGAAGWWAGTTITTPAQLAAETAPPEPTLITVPVESTEIAVEVVTRGTVSYGEATKIAMADPPALPNADPIVTGAPIEGAELNEGDLVMEVSFQPVFVLAGRLPAFRDFVRGMEGADVVQLQEALTRLGYYSTEVDGKFGTATQQAVAAWFADNDYRPLGLDRGVSGIYIAKEELMFLPELPQRIDSAGVGIGDNPAVADAVVTLTGTRLSIRAAVASADAVQMSVGQPVDIRDDVTDTVVEGTLGVIADDIGTDPDNPGLVAIEVTPGPGADRLAGANVRLSITVASTGEGVLAVPVSAVYSTVQGVSSVEVAEPDGTTRLVTVELGLSSAGLVEITPLEGELHAGDNVVVGNG